MYGLQVISNKRLEEDEIELDIDKTLAEHFTSLQNIPKKKDKVPEQKPPSADTDDLSDTRYSSDSGASSTSNSSDSSDRYSSSGNPKVDAASSDIDEDDALFAPLNGYDASGNTCVIFDLTLACMGEDTQTDTIMEDCHTPNEEISTLPQNSNEALRHLQLSKNLKLFLNDVIGMTMCPISREQMIHLFVAPDTYSYARHKISEWLSKKQISPLTRDIMGIFMLTQDHTMERVMKSMNDRNITESVIENLGTVKDTTSSTGLPTSSIGAATTTSTINPPTESIDNMSDNTLQHIRMKINKAREVP